MPAPSPTLVQARAREAVPNAAQDDYIWQPFWIFMFVLAIIQFSTAWIFPPSKFGGIETMINEKPFGVPFQYTLWLTLVVGICVHISRAGFDMFIKVLVPWLPFLGAALIASVFGITPISSFRGIIFWFLGAIAAFTAAWELAPRVSLKVLTNMLAGIVILSVFLALVLPSVGAQVQGAVWRGVFSNKNQLGWISALILVVCVNVWTRQRWKLPALVTLLAVVCLFKSGSKGALVAAIVTMGYLWLVSLLRSRVTVALGVTAVLFSLICVLLFGFFIMPELLSILGKDPTLTGRTIVWSMYFNSMMNTPFLGAGPGAYTNLSELTAPLAMRLVELGAIVTPHNAFLGAFGDAGIVGLLAFAGVLIYLGIFAPFIKSDKPTLICAGVAFLNMAHGMVETHEVFGAGFGWFLMLYFRSLSLRERTDALKLQAQSELAPASALPASALARR